jgi:NitT/TauT family transport system ATP-binding protein
VFVTHSVAEAVFLSTRIVVLAPNPGRVYETLEVGLAYPRTAALRLSAEFDALTAKVSRSLRGALVS